MNYEYWKECVEDALYEAEITANNTQIAIIAEFIEGCHESYGMATGDDVASMNFESEESKELKKLKNEIKNKESWILSTRQCTNCKDGIVIDGWGRNQECMVCHGAGRVK